MDSFNRRKEAIQRKLTYLDDEVSELDENADLAVFEEYLKEVETANIDYYAVKNIIYSEIDKIEANRTMNQQGIEGLITFQESSFLAIEKSFIFLKAKIKTKINLIKSRNNPNPSNNSTSNNTQRNVVYTSKLHLPQLKLPSFSGRYEDYGPFKEKFLALVHNCPDILEIQKLQILLDALPENVRKGFEHLEFVEANYTVIAEKLDQRFSNKKFSVDRHISGLVNMKSMTRESSTELQTVVDISSLHVGALKSLGIEVDTWDAIIIYHVSSKLDNETRKKWEESVNKDNLPKWNTMREFLQSRCNALQSVEMAIDLKKKFASSKDSKPPVKSFAVSNDSNSCPKCHGAHKLIDCREFVGLPVEKRAEFVKSNRICYNCLKYNHMSKSCPLASACTTCSPSVKKKHSFLLHFGKQENNDSPKKDSEPKNEKESETKKPVRTFNCSVENQKGPQIVLMTALVYVYGSNDKMQLARALLDPGSESSFMTSEFASKLGLKAEECKRSIVGVDGMRGACKGQLKAYIRSRHKDYGNSIQFLIVNKVTKTIPSEGFSVESWSVPSHVELADPEFNTPGQIDILLGGEIFMELLQSDCIKLRQDIPYLRETKLGYVWSGKRFEGEAGEEVICSLVTNDDLNQQLSKFWSLETPSTSEESSLEEILCEKKFIDSVGRDETGRYEVGLMLKDDASSLGNSKKIAMARLNSLWKRLDLDTNLKKMYCDLMAELLQLKHMEEVKEEKVGPHGVYYMPHHAVHRPDNTTSKMRLVFNASQKTDNNLSLNDILLNGGLAQPSLHVIMLNHRTKKYAFSVDIVKMFRQFKLKPEYRSLLRILWKWSANDPVKIYEMIRVTNGTKDAPFTATRVLKQLALDYQTKYPLASLILLTRFYMDNGLFGSDSAEEAKLMVRELDMIMKEGEMELQKWCCNEPTLLRNVSSDHQECFKFDEGESEEMIKTLGMLWSPKEDVYKFVVKKEFLSEDTKITKRIVLSELAKIFDPLGLINPLVVRAKMFLQKLWKFKYDWDDVLTDEFGLEWLKFRKELLLVSEIQIPRFINPLMATRFELIGFSDASKEAYGICVYVKSIDDSENSTTRLIYSKSRVAPVEETSIPRLELEAAVLLAENISFLIKSVDLKFERVRLYSDSKVVLAWLKTEIYKLQLYVANRVRSIKKVSGQYDWSYVNTKNNPADIVSRGINVKKLINCRLWWEGPSELVETELMKMQDSDQISYEMEVRRNERATTCLLTVDDSERFSMFKGISKFSSAQRIMAYMIRFISNCRLKREERVIGRLTTGELNGGLLKLVEIVQFDSFPLELKALKEKGTLPNNHHMKSLNLVLVNGVIRVGGRISNSSFSFDKRHQMLLPKGHQFTFMIITDLHSRYLHVGPQGLLAIIRERFWIVNGKNVVRKIVHNCIKCFKSSPRDVETFMGDLPNCRVEPSFPFFVTGVDCGGPFNIRLGGPRSKQVVKSWFVIFLCMTTKAIHLELITSLSSEAFRSCLQRFICRRGHAHSLKSDNGTNFVGSKRELEELRTLYNKENMKRIEDFCLEEKINWSTIPPRASHFGGEWEAGVKSIKYHLKRIAGNALLNYEEMLTLLIQIEGILNSRPLYAMSTDPNDLNPITPAHFLIGRSITCLPEPDFTETAANRLTRFARITQIRQHFWKRFSVEYVTSLQQRSKWFKTKPNIELNQLVMLKEDGLPSFKWKTGRIIKLFPGKDNVTRVVLVKLANGQELKRDTKKICVLPLESSFFN